jgi:5'-3' exonuclease
MRSHRIILANMAWWHFNFCSIQRQQPSGRQTAQTPRQSSQHSFSFHTLSMQKRKSLKSKPLKAFVWCFGTEILTSSPFWRNQSNSKYKKHSPLHKSKRPSLWQPKLQDSWLCWISCPLLYRWCPASSAAIQPQPSVDLSTPQLMKKLRQRGI